MRPILTVVAAVLLTGCGLKDDLYMPETEPSEAEANTSESVQDDDDGDATNP